MGQQRWAAVSDLFLSHVFLESDMAMVEPENLQQVGHASLTAEQTLCPKGKGGQGSGGHSPASPGLRRDGGRLRW